MLTLASSGAPFRMPTSQTNQPPEVEVKVNCLQRHGTRPDSFRNASETSDARKVVDVNKFELAVGGDQIKVWEAEQGGEDVAGWEFVYRGKSELRGRGSSLDTSEQDISTRG